MKNTILLILSISLISLMAACKGSTSDSAGKTSQVTKITAEEAHERMQSGDPVIILDVRTAEEYAEKHIPGAILLPNEEIGTTPPSVLPERDAEILVYCRSGNRSAQAAKKLVDMGYSKVFDFGGINGWTYETETGAYEAQKNQ